MLDSVIKTWLDLDPIESLSNNSLGSRGAVFPVWIYTNIYEIGAVLLGQT